MNNTLMSHQLAQELLALPNTRVTASVDVSTGSHDDLNRAFGDFLTGWQMESDGELTLLFIEGHLNFEVNNGK